jgi:diguanylate cyclase (GGDEF)-like protein/PAS domain S-box-containing protein
VDFADELNAAALPRGASMSGFEDPEICRTILESLCTGVCVVDREKKIIFWSDGAEQITGHLRHEVMGRLCEGRALLQCDEPDCESCNEDSPLARAIKTSHPAEALGFIHHKAGHEVPVYIRASPVRNAHGSIIGAVETFETHEPTTSPDHREAGLKLSGCVDDVTGLSNHAMMQSHLREALGIFHDFHIRFGILFFQLEGLIEFRTSFGQEAASALLRMVAHDLENTLWRTDFVGRWSDDEFLVILSGCAEEALQSIQSRVRRILANDRIEWWGERRSLPIRIGNATVHPDDSLEALMERAHKSMAVSVAHDRSASASTKVASSGS